MRNLVMVTLAALSFAAFGSANAEGLFTKVDTYTLEGMGGVRASGSPVNIYQVNIPGFNNLADCTAALQALKDRDYPGTSGSSSTIISTLYVSFEGTCHKVKAIIPVMDQPAS